MYDCLKHKFKLERAGRRGYHFKCSKCDATRTIGKRSFWANHRLTIAEIMA